jgi:hypothetical protein
LQFIFFVHTAFFPFARFVARLIAIITALIPFIVASAMVVVALTYRCIIMGARKDAYENFGNCLRFTCKGIGDTPDRGDTSAVIRGTPNLDIAFNISHSDVVKQCSHCFC